MQPTVRPGLGSEDPMQGGEFSGLASFDTDQSYRLELEPIPQCHVSGDESSIFAFGIPSMGLPDQAKAKPVSSLRAFFEQQGNAAGSSQAETPGSPALNGGAQKARVKSNFIPVSRAMNLTPTEKVEAVMKAGPPFSKPTDEISEPVKAKSTLERENVKQEQEIPKTDEAVHEPVSRPSADDNLKPQASEAVPIGPDTLTSTDLGPKKKKVEETPGDKKIVPTQDDTGPVMITKRSAIPKAIASSSSPKSAPTPKRPVTSLTPKSTPTPKKPIELASTPKSPPTPKQTPTSAKPSPKVKISLGPLSPTKSTSSRRSSSPFLVSPTGAKVTPQRGSTPAATSTSRIPTPKSQARSESTPKSLNKASRSDPPTAVIPATPPQAKASSTPVKRAPPANELSPPPIRDGQLRPRSAQGNLTSAPGSRRIVSHPPRPSTSASNKPSPNVTRTTSLRNPPRTKPPASVHPPVPPVARAAGSLSPEHKDYSHLPTFMRPTQASSGKVVPKPVSTGDQRRARAGSFKV